MRTWFVQSSKLLRQSVASYNMLNTYLLNLIKTRKKKSRALFLDFKFRFTVNDSMIPKKGPLWKRRSLRWCSQRGPLNICFFYVASRLANLFGTVISSPIQHVSTQSDMDFGLSEKELIQLSVNLIRIKLNIMPEGQNWKVPIKK